MHGELPSALLSVAETSCKTPPDMGLEIRAMQQPLEAIERPDGLSEVRDFRSQLQPKVPVRNEQTATGRPLALRETPPTADGGVRPDEAPTHDHRLREREREIARRTSSSLIP